MLFTTILVGTFVLIKVLDKTIMGNSNDDPQKWLCTLKFYGANSTYDITNNYQIWRLVTSALLH